MHRAFRTPHGTINVFFNDELLCTLPPEFPEEFIVTLCAVHWEGLSAGERHALQQMDFQQLEAA